jgi:beta-galactosidase
MQHYTLPFIFDEPQKGVLMKVMGNAKEWVTIIINKSEVRREFKIMILQNPSLQPIVIFANNGGKAGGTHISIEAEETLVIKWV